MAAEYKQLTDFLVRLGIAEVDHSDKSFLAHLIGVYQDMKTHGCNEELARAGMFHSIYGTQMFQGFKLGLEERPKVRELIGERAERLAYCNCAMDRPSFDRILDQQQAPYRFLDRITHETIELSREDFDDLCKIHLYDWLEQVPRSQKWSYRRDAFRRMAERLGGVALEAFDSVFAQEAKAS